MKTLRLMLAFAVTGLLAAALQAEDKKDHADSKQAKCCAKAAADGKECSHDCCVEAAKAGENCTKCGGHGKVEPKK